MFILAVAPSVRIHVDSCKHEPVGTEDWPSTEPAVARCLLCHAMVHSARSCTRRNAAFSALKLPSALAHEVAYSHVMQPRKRERPGCNGRHTWDVSPPLNTRVLRTRMLERPNGSSQARHCPRP